MNLIDDDVFARELREAVDSVTLLTPGPDVARIRRRGTARRRRHQAAVAGGMAAVLALAGTLALTVNNNDSLDQADSGFAGSGAVVEAADQTSDPARVAEIIHGVLDEADIVYPAMPQDHRDGLTTAGEDGDAGQNIFWAKRWSITTTQPKIAVNLVVSPEQWLPEAAYPCKQGAPDQMRSCRDEVLSNGVRLLSGEDSGGGLVTGSDRWSMWSPTALAVYPDGRQVSMTVGLLKEEGDPVPTGVVIEDYPGPISLDQLRAVVANPELARLALPQ